MTEQIRLSRNSNQDDVGKEEYAKFSPDLTFLLRDSFLNFQDKNGNKITPN